ncbi:ATP-dependent DNA ligase [Desertihabitans brevis]|uniref:DNA ligase (ATP) n=1 Tax=Desertihabitans brevis TaxID=2268447 RepID=A0A367YRW9_9ACTN|nr:non-homologous end-joining DNA ligase [Desertihabitans brevis]RCK68633.1 ATP-dependent DNA ligase [Desertihabitans brevis]
MPAQGQQITVDGRTLRLTNLDKVLFAETGTTKGEMLHYYSEIAPLLLPQLRRRPCTRKRWPEGAGGSGRELVFFTKNLDSGTPDWVPRVRVEHSDRPVDYPVVGDVATLTWLAQLAAVELHVPQWRFDDDDTPGHPDRLVLDLDPGPGVGLAECALVARSARDLLAEVGLASVPVTSGSKGIHLYAALDGERTSEEASDLARQIAGVLQRMHPDLVIAVMRRSERVGKVFIDWSQNNAAKTTIAPYSLRGRGRPWVAAPRIWEELDEPDLTHLELAEVLERAATMDDPMAALLDDPADEHPTRPRHPSRSQLPTRARRPEPVEGRSADPPADTEDAPAPLPALSPMMASSPRGRTAAFTETGDWVFEMKWDGVRALVAVDADGAQLTSRRGLAMSATYPELARDLAALAGRRVVLDGEVVALDEQGRPSFERLQHRINLTRPSDISRAMTSTPVQLLLFDLLVLDGEPVVDRPLEERRTALEELVQGTAGLGPRVQVPPVLGQDFETAMEVSRGLGGEGLVAKRCGSRYTPGLRSEQWMKVKNIRTQDVVVVGWTEGRNGRTGEIGALVLAVQGEDGLHYVGKVGSGFSQRSLREAAGLLEPLARAEAPVGDVPRADAAGVHWVDPLLVGEVHYMDWTDVRRLRHPTWRGWRPDVLPEDVRAEQPLP